MKQKSFSVEYIPPSWGHIVPRPLKHSVQIGKLQEEDLEFLKILKEEFAHLSGLLISYQDIFEVHNKIHKEKKHWACKKQLTRLWLYGRIEKYAGSWHTQSNRANYVKYYIWQYMIIAQREEGSIVFLED